MHGDERAQQMAAMALPSASVLPVPPMSAVSGAASGPMANTVSIAVRTAAPASGCPRWSSIMAPHQICPIGLAIPLPAMSGAEP